MTLDALLVKVFYVLLATVAALGVVACGAMVLGEVIEAIKKVRW